MSAEPPTVGRIVHFYDLYGTRYAAIVSREGGLRPDLAVFTGDSDSPVEHRGMVPHRSVHAAERSDCWDWPPRV
jgi:hypothetical protein